MSPKLQNQIAKSKEQALAAFVSKKAEIDAMLTRLQALSDDHFGYAPTRSPGATSAPWSTTPSCSSASPTAPSRKASTPVAAPDLPPPPRAACRRRGSGRRRAMVLSETEIIP